MNYPTPVTKHKTHIQKAETEKGTTNVFRGHIPVVRKTHNYDSLNYNNQSEVMRQPRSQNLTLGFMERTWERG